MYRKYINIINSSFYAGKIELQFCVVALHNFPITVLPSITHIQVISSQGLSNLIRFTKNKKDIYLLRRNGYGCQKFDKFINIFNLIFVISVIS